MRSNPAHLFFIFETENTLRSNLNFTSFYGRSTDFKVLIRVNLSEFYMAWRKISLKYLLIGGGPDGVDIAHAQTG